MLLTDAEIRKAIEDGRLNIINFDEKGLEPASYDMRLGEEAITSGRREKENPSHRGLLGIPVGDFALVTTHEKVELSSSIAGHIGLRSHYAKRGLVLLSGPQIDPGFKGTLVLGLVNLSPRDIIIPYRERFCTIEFHALTTPASRPYSGEYQGQQGIWPTDLENLVEAQGMTFGQVIKLLSELTQNVKSLSDSVAFMKWTYPIGLTFLALLIAVVGLVLKLT